MLKKIIQKKRRCIRRAEATMSGQTTGSADQLVPFKARRGVLQPYEKAAEKKKSITIFGRGHLRKKEEDDLQLREAWGLHQEGPSRSRRHTSLKNCRERRER